MSQELLPLESCLELLDCLALRVAESEELLLDRAGTRVQGTADLALELRKDFKKYARTRTKPVDLGTFHIALARTVKYNRVGLWLDHNEWHLFRDDCQFAFNGPWILKTAGPDDVFGYRRRTLDSASFEAFDEWLRSCFERERDAIEPGSAESTVDLSPRRLRLVMVDTGEDFWVAVLHPAGSIDQLIEKFAELGIRAWRAVPESDAEAEAWIPQEVEVADIDSLAPRTLDVAQAHLIERHGFEVVEVEQNEEGTRRSCSLRRGVDADHSVLISITENYPSWTGLDIGVCRRDLTELFAQLIPETYSVTSPTVQERGSSFPGRPAGLWEIFVESEDITSYLDEWVPKYLPLANLDFITTYLESKTSLNSKIPAEGWNRAMNRMLSGWEPDNYPTLNDDETFMDPWGLEGRFSAWIDEHPNGTREGKADR